MVLRSKTEISSTTNADAKRKLLDRPFRFTATETVLTDLFSFFSRAMFHIPPEFQMYIDVFVKFISEDATYIQQIYHRANQETEAVLRLPTLPLHVHLGILETATEKWRKALPAMSSRPSYGHQAPLSDNKVLRKLTPLSAIFGGMTINDAYIRITLIKALDRDLMLRRVYLQPGHKRAPFARPLRVRIVHVRHSSLRTVNKGLHERCIVSVTPLVLDPERDFGPFDILYVSIFIGPPDNEAFFLAVPITLCMTTRGAAWDQSE